MSTRSTASHAASYATSRTVRPARSRSPEPEPQPQLRPAQPKEQLPRAPRRSAGQSSLFPGQPEPLPASANALHDAAAPAAASASSVCGDPPARAHEAPRPARRSRASRSAATPDAEANRADDVFVPAGSIVPPGEPPHPVAGLAAPDGQPRQWEYPAGYNIGHLPRAGEPTCFAELRSLAALFDGIQLCERVYFDLLGRLELRLVPRPEALESGDTGSGRRWRQRASPIEDFLQSPDKVQDLRSWLVAFVRDLLEIDAVVIYTRQTRGGRLHALELVDGATIRPLIDAAGRAPRPPMPAFQQYLYGVPAGEYTLAELDYIRETARTDSVYGLSRVERIILRVNQALRKQDFDLARFTDGSTPLGLIEPPVSMDWTPEQIDAYERTFNGLLAGNAQLRVHARTLPPGSTWHALTGDDPMIGFDRFLLNVTVAAFGLTMDELGFTETSNRSTGQSQEAVVYRRAVAPVATLAAGYLTRKVRHWLDPRFTVTFAGLEEPEDFAVRADAFAKLIPLGVVTPATAARLLHLPAPGSQ